MVIKSLYLTDFRSHKELELELAPVVILIGSNGAGKTNIVEAIWMLAAGKSWRTAKDIEVINWDSEFARIKMKILSEKDKKTEIELFLQKYLSRERPQLKQAKINDVKKRLVEIVGVVPAVLFSPEEISLIDGPPSLRRRFLDIMLAQTDKNYTYALVEFNKVLKERNKLLGFLKNGRAKEDELDFWDKKLIETGTLIVGKREEAVKFLNLILPKIYNEISGRESDNTFIKYQPSAPHERLDDIIYAHRERDIETAVTNYGPHRDDFMIFVEGRDLATFGSRGEYRSAVLAIKIAELEYLKQKTGESPILLLDDIFSELDYERRMHLAKIVRSQQTIITTTDLDHIEKELQKEAKIVKL